MAVELGVAYLSIIPSFKNMNSSIKSAMGPVESEMAAAGQRGGIAAGGTFSKGMASGVSSSSGAMTGAMNTVGAQTTTAAGVHGKNAGTSLGQKMMTGFLAVGVAGMVVGSIKGAIDTYMQSAVDVNALKRITGGSTEDTSRLSTELTLAGVTSEKASTSIRLFSKNLGTAAADAGKTAEMTDRLGVAFTNADGSVKPLTELMGPLADKFQSMPNGAEKTALAMKLFGRSGADMLPFLNKGAAGLEELGQKSDEFGLTLTDNSIGAMGDAKMKAREFEASIKGLKISLGEALLPVMTTVQQFIRSYFIPVFREIGQLIKDNSSWLMPMVAGLLAWYAATKLVTLGTKAWTSAMTACGVVMAAWDFLITKQNIQLGWMNIKIWAMTAAQYAVTAAQWLWNAALVVGAGAMAVLTSPITLVVVAIAALAAGVIYAYNNFEWFRTGVQVVWDVVQNVVSFAWNNVIKPVFDAIAGAIAGAIDFFTNFGDRVSTIWTNITGWISTGFTTVVQWFMDLPGSIWSAVQSLWSTVTTWGSQLLTWILGGIASGAVAVWAWFTNLPDALWGSIQTAWSTVVEWGKSLIVSIAIGIGNAYPVIWQWFLDLPSTLWGYVQSAWSTVAGWGQQLITWIWNGLVNAWPFVVQFFQELPGKLWDTVVGWVSAVVSWGTGIINNITSGLGQAWPFVVQFFQELPGKLWDTVKGWAESIIGWGNGIIDNITTGLGRAWPFVVQFFQELPGKLSDTVKGWGESAVGWGKGIVENIAKGISGAKDVIVKAFTDLFSISFSIGGATGKIGVGGIEITTGNATGGVIPGTDPGRRDNVLTPMRSGEAVMVPEWTRAVGGASTVHAMNRAAESGSLNLSAFGPGYAMGGVVGEDKGPYGLGVKTAKLAYDKISEWAKGIFDAKAAASISGGINTSQDPNTFGWKQASGIVPYAWNGHPIVGGVAGGTEGLWGALLNELVPGIPGGLTGPMWGYENRANVNSPGSASFHAFGLATDINAEQNPNGAPGDGRSGNGVIPAGLARSVAAKLGMLWGGDFTGTPDPMHFEIHVSPGQIHGGSVTLADTGRASGGYGSFASGGSGVERWRGTVLQGLSMIGQPASLADTVLNQIRTESSGDPNAINLTDINAQRGYPSRGLVQTIPQTFASYALPGYNTNIVDPLSNIISGMRYAIARYGSISAGMRGVAYDNGGWLQPGGMGRNFLNRPEAVLTPDQSKAYQTHAESLAAGYGGSVQGSPGVTFSGDIHLGQGGPQELFDEALWRARAMVGR